MFFTEIDQWIAAIYDDVIWIGQVMSITEGRYKVQFMKPSKTANRYYNLYLCKLTWFSLSKTLFKENKFTLQYFKLMLLTE